MVVVVEALDGRVLDRPVHSLDLTIGPRVVGLGQPVLDPVGFADHVEAHRPGIDGVAVPRLLGELDAIVGEDRVQPVRNSFKKSFQKRDRRRPVSLVM